MNNTPLHFNGPVYNPTKDQIRLTGQCLRVFRHMKDQGWHTLAEISAATGDPEASISAQLRHLKKARFGGHTITKVRRTDGQWEYQLTVNPLSWERLEATLTTQLQQA